LKKHEVRWAAQDLLLNLLADQLIAVVILANVALPPAHQQLLEAIARWSAALLLDPLLDRRLLCLTEDAAVKAGEQRAFLLSFLNIKGQSVEVQADYPDLVQHKQWDQKEFGEALSLLELQQFEVLFYEAGEQARLLLPVRGDVPEYLKSLLTDL